VFFVLQCVAVTCVSLLTRTYWGISNIMVPVKKQVTLGAAIRTWNACVSFESEPAALEVCCSVLHYVAVCCILLQCVALHGSVLQCNVVCCSVLQCVVLHGSVLQCAALCCVVLQYVAVCCSPVQYVAVQCRVL